jgi:hypothetical protein
MFLSKFVKKLFNKKHKDKKNKKAKHDGVMVETFSVQVVKNGN